MPRCEDQWRRTGDVAVGVIANAADPAQQYSLVYVLYRNDPQARLLPGGTFDSVQLRQGVQWNVPEGYRCEFELISTSNGVIATQITLKGAPVVCNPGSHCQGNCSPTGAAGIAGFWAVTAARRP